MTRPITEHIEITPGVCGGKPRIAGHRIAVQNVVLWHERGGLSPDEIVSRNTGLTLADVYAALVYYHDHRDEIRARIREDEAFADRLKATSPSPLAEKLRRKDAACFVKTSESVAGAERSEAPARRGAE
jgi:uncharacterized protein (DUF433 family)